MFSLQLPIPAAANTSFRSNNLITKPLFSTCPTNITESCKTNSSPLRLRLAGRQKCSISEIEHEINQTELPAGLTRELMPKHVAVIMDGNRRWAISKGLPLHEGHRAGGKALVQLCTNCLKYGVKVVTVFAFSTENWIRPQGEINYMVELFGEFMIFDTEKLMQKRYDVRLSFMGSRWQLPEPMQKLMSDAEEQSKDNKRMQLVIALNYSGRSDITEATRKIATKVKHEVLQVEDIDDAVFEEHLGTNVIAGFPNPDLMIRSSGELRISNFMLWQLAYSEMFFTNKLFPEFDETDFMEAITAFQRRQRRFGGRKYYN